jgi:DNA adenine methylase
MASCPSKQKPRSVEGSKSCEKGLKDMEIGRAKPILKWAGGKSWFVREFGQDMCTHLEERGGRYLEPFLGGGAMALYLGHGNAMLGDLDEELVNVYIAVRHMPGAVHGMLEELTQFGTDEKSYYAVRDSESDDMVESAARTIYLNKLCFNGLYRKNKKGIFNVPYGGQAKMPSLEMLLNAATALTGSRLFVADFETIIQEAGENDTIYGDPPYHGAFSGYSGEGFGEDDHERLAEALYYAQERGASFLLHNADTEHVHWLYEDWADIVPTEERRSVSASGEARGEKAPCLLICSRERDGNT